MAEQQAAVALRVGGEVHVGGLGGLGVQGLLVQGLPGLPGALRGVVEVAVGRVAAHTLAWTQERERYSVVLGGQMFDLVSAF